MTGAADRAAVLDRFDVSRETITRLDRYAAILIKWNPRINLVAKSTIPNIWSRHLADSLQLVRHFLPGDRRYCDFGSGGGLPGLVLASVLAETNPDLKVVLVESDARKAAFLIAAAKEIGISPEISNTRVEDLQPMRADVISARALAPLPKLVGLCMPHLAIGGRCLFMKGAAYRRELDESLESWRFESEKWASETNPDAVVLQLRNIRHV